MVTEPITGAPDLQLGRILIEWGIVTEAAMKECVELQHKLQSESATYVPRLGEILVERGYATADQIMEALAAQNRKIMFCNACSVNVNVDIRPDVLSYRCGKCQGELADPPVSADIKVVESTIMFVIRDPLPPEVQEAVQNPGSRFGKYVVISEIGRGGIGVVCKAWDTYLGQYVALKRLKPEPGDVKRGPSREGYIQSLLKEARNAVRLRHPHIATVFDIGRVDHEFYIAMEYLEGRTLGADFLEARQTAQVSPFFRSPKRYLRYLRDVARAVHYAHTRPSPVVHCDMKPSNIFIDKNDRAYVLDFGLARNLKALQDDQPGTISGTPSYMAPEQASGHPEDIDARTDVYGIGAILYELLTGRPPFVGSLQSVLRKSISDVPDRPTDVITHRAGADTTRLLARVPPELEDLSLRCLQKEPTMRFQTAHELANCLDRIIKGDTSTARSAPGAVTPLPVPAPQLKRAIQDDPPTGASPLVEVSYSPPTGAAPAIRLETPRAERPLRRFAHFAAGAAVAALLFGIFWVIRDYVTRPAGPGTAASRRASSDALIQELVEAFRPDLAQQEVRQALERSPSPQESLRLEDVKSELQWMETVKQRILIASSGARIAVEGFRLRSGPPVRAEVLKVQEHQVLLLASGEVTECPWSRIHPEQVVDLATAFLKEPTPEDRLGLALYARRAGALARARALFDTLKGTTIESAAARYVK